MKVTKVQSPKTAEAGKKRKAASADGPNFRAHLQTGSDSVQETAAPAGTAAISPIQSVLAAQEAGDHEEADARRELFRHGDDLLDRLDELRHDILTGAVSRNRLENLTRRLRARRSTVTDPKLIEIINEIELRAEVEIAKLSREF